MIDAITPSARLVLPRLLKSVVAGQQKYAHQGGYFLHQGRWHKLHQDKPAPKGAPIAAHPHAAGQHAPAKHLTDEQWAQLKLPDSNVNAGTYNKQLEQLKQHSEAGHVTGILGSGFGTNTYGVKLAKVANHLLGLHGSQHQVKPGQKAGEHEAVKQVPVPAAPAAQPKPFDHGELNVPGKTSNLDAQIDKHKAAEAAQKKADAKAASQEKKSDKAQAKELFAQLGQTMIDKMAPGIAKKQGLTEKQAAKEIQSTLDSMVKWEPAKFLVLAAKFQKEQATPAHEPQAAKPSTGEPQKAAAPVAHTQHKLPDLDGVLSLKPQGLSAMSGGAVADQIQAHYQAGDLKALQNIKDNLFTPTFGGKTVYDGKAKKAMEGFLDAAIKKLGGAAAPAEPGPKEGDTKQGADGALIFKDGRWHKQNEQPADLPGVGAVSEPLPSQDGGGSALSMPAFSGGTVGQSVIDYYEGVAKQVLDLATAGDHAALEQIKSDGLKPNKKGKISNTWAGKTANSKLLLDLHAKAMEQAKAGNPAAAASKPARLGTPAPSAPEPEPAHPVPPSAAEQGFEPAPAAQPQPAPASTDKLAQIPWDKQLLPDSNSNAKSHNKQVAKIKQLAEAGDVAGLEALKFGVNTYGKKQELLKQTAIAALKEGATQTSHSAAPAAPSVTPPPEPQPESTPQTVNLKGFGQYTKQPDGSWKSPSEGAAVPGSYMWAVAQLSSGAGMEGHKLNPGMKMDAVLEAVQNGASPTKALNEVYAPGSENGPKEGDTKVVNGVTYQLTNGRWHKVSPDAQAAQQPAASPAAPEPAAAPVQPEPEPQHPIDAIPVPDEIKNASNKNWSAAAIKSLDKLKAKLKAGDTDVLKGATKHMTGSGMYIVKLPHYSDADYMQNQSVKLKGGGAAAKALYEHVEALKAAMGKAPKKKATPKAPPVPAATPFPGAASGAPEPMDSWVQTGGQGGSNPGGKFKDPSGQEWYCKFPGDDDVAKSEVLAAKLYSLAGLASQDAKLITKGGKIGIASKWVDVKKAPSPKELAAVADAQAGFAVDAWLGNWDVVGLSYDNLQVGADGKAVRVDAGGSLEYRAQGAKKPFGSKVEEIDTLRDKAKNPQAAAIFGSMTEADITASVAKVLKISDVAIRAMVNQFGPGAADEKAKLADTLIARKKDLAAKYPAAAKATKKHTFDPAKISAPPSFMNWGGSGKSGPSSKEFVNKANEDAVQAVFAAAKTGDIDAVKNLDLPVYNKDTGQQSGHAKALDHPSQHVKGYAQQAINEITYQLNPPKRFRFEGGHPLAALHNAYPSHPGGTTSQTVQKLGKFLMLGEPGTVKLDDLQLPPTIKHAEAGGTLTTSTYSPAAKAAFSKMPATQKQAIQSYTGSSYHEINGSLWSGNPSGAAKAAGEALKTLGHDIQPGTVLSRKISLHGADLDMLLKSQGKVLQEPAVMSTSIRPSSWSGNVHLKLHVGPGVKGLWVGNGSNPSGGAISKHSGEDEMILPPGTRLLILGVKKGPDPDGFGKSSSHIVEAVILPTS